MALSWRIHCLLLKNHPWRSKCGRLYSFQCSEPHTPVLLHETLCELNLQPGQTLLDMTFGAGGHATGALKSTPSLNLIALDRDPTAVRYAHNLADSFPGQVTALHGKFSDIPALLGNLKIEHGSIDAILFDLGCSSMQFDLGNRGFSISKNGPLDMRMDPTDSTILTAKDVIAHANEADLGRIFKYYGDEKQCKLIARALVESRFSIQPVTTTEQLCKLVEMTLGFSYRQDKLQRKSHVATKVFQALRIFVNNEINELNYGLILAHKYLRMGGKVAAISFHSLEDRVVKRHLSGNVVDNAVSPLPLKYTSYSKVFDVDEMFGFSSNNWDAHYREIITPSAEEVKRNPRCRSAKLRVATKIKN